MRLRLWKQEGWKNSFSPKHSLATIATFCALALFSACSQTKSLTWQQSKPQTYKTKTVPKKEKAGIEIRSEFSLQHNTDQDRDAWWVPIGTHDTLWYYRDDTDDYIQWLQQKEQELHAQWLDRVTSEYNNEIYFCDPREWWAKDFHEQRERPFIDFLVSGESQGTFSYNGKSCIVTKRWRNRDISFDNESMKLEDFFYRIADYFGEATLLDHPRMIRWIQGAISQGDPSSLWSWFVVIWDMVYVPAIQEFRVDRWSASDPTRYWSTLREEREEYNTQRKDRFYRDIGVVLDKDKESRGDRTYIDTPQNILEKLKEIQLSTESGEWEKRVFQILAYLAWFVDASSMYNHNLGTSLDNDELPSLSTLVVWAVDAIGNRSHDPDQFLMTFEKLVNNEEIPYEEQVTCINYARVVAWFLGELGYETSIWLVHTSITHSAAIAKTANGYVMVDAWDFFYADNPKALFDMYSKKKALFTHSFAAPFYYMTDMGGKITHSFASPLQQQMAANVFGGRTYSNMLYKTFDNTVWETTQHGKNHRFHAVRENVNEHDITSIWYTHQKRERSLSVYGGMIWWQRRRDLGKEFGSFKQHITYAQFAYTNKRDLLEQERRDHKIQTHLATSHLLQYSWRTIPTLTSLVAPDMVYRHQELPLKISTWIFVLLANPSQHVYFRPMYAGFFVWWDAKLSRFHPLSLSWLYEQNFQNKHMDLSLRKVFSQRSDTEIAAMVWWQVHDNEFSQERWLSIWWQYRYNNWSMTATWRLGDMTWVVGQSLWLQLTLVYRPPHKPQKKTR